jgi:hypothetical protein
MKSGNVIVVRDRLQQQIRRQVAAWFEHENDIRFIILTSTIVPNRNWFVLVTRNEFIVVRVSRLRLRALAIEERFPRTLLESRITPTLRRAVVIGMRDHYVSRLQLRHLRAHNADYLTSASSPEATESHTAKIAALRRAVKDYEQSLLMTPRS